MDRGYVDFARLFLFTLGVAVLVVRIETFYHTSGNAVKTQIWIAVPISRTS